MPKIVNSIKASRPYSPPGYARDGSGGHSFMRLDVTDARAENGRLGSTRRRGRQGAAGVACYHPCYHPEPIQADPA